MPADTVSARINRSIQFPRVVLAAPGLKPAEPFHARARIPSHEISEKWGLQPLYYYMEDGEVFPGSEIRLDVNYIHQGKSIGEAYLSLTGNVASIMTCWFRSFVPGQKLGTEFAARTYMRAHDIGRMIGWDPLYAHAYYYLTENEIPNNFDYSNADLPVYDCFRWIGLSRDFSPMPRSHGGANTGSGDLNNHGAILRDVYNNCLEYWKEWFYIPRKGEATVEINLHEAEAALNNQFDAARADLMTQLDEVLGTVYKE